MYYSKKEYGSFIEESCPWDTNIAQKINEKKATYIQLLRTQLEMMYSKVICRVGNWSYCNSTQIFTYNVTKNNSK